MELKPFDKVCAAEGYAAFNRTFMELKPGLIRAHFEWVKLLIAPLWN